MSTRSWKDKMVSKAYTFLYEMFNQLTIFPVAGENSGEDRSYGTLTNVALGEPSKIRER